MLVPAWQQQFRISNCSKNLHTNFTKHLIYLGEGNSKAREEKAKERRQGKGTQDLIS